MSYEFQSTLHRSARAMCAAIAEQWVTAGGANSAAEVAGHFASATDADLASECASAWGLGEPDAASESRGESKTWLEARDASSADLAAAFAELRATICPNIMSKIEIIESRGVERDYGFEGVEAIIEHPQHGRIFLADGYGELGTSGGCVRWQHGIAIKLLPGDTLSSLDGAAWNDDVTLMDAVVGGYDKQRPILDWHGHAIDAVARAAGL